MSVPGNLYTPTIRKTRGGDYLIEQSLLFNDDDSAYLTRTPGSAGNRKTWTYSCWLKPSTSGTYESLLYVGGGANYTHILLNSDSKIYILSDTASVRTVTLYTDALFRDPSAWYHIVIACDTTQATDTDKIRLWVNGVQVDLLSGTPNYPSLNEDLHVNNSVVHNIGYDGSYYLDGLMALPILVDGAALDPTSFGEEDADGYWNPIEFSGTTTVEESLIAQGTGTAFGDLDSTTQPGYAPGSGLSAAFDGDKVEISSGTRSTSDAQGNGYIGKDYSGSSGKAIYAVNTYGSGNEGYAITSGTNGDITISLYGSNSTPSSGTDGTLLGTTGEFNNVNNQNPLTIYSNDTSTVYDYVWVYIVDSFSATAVVGIVELEFVEAVNTAASFGTNGFVLDFSDTSNFGDDTSGNGNDYTPNNFTAADQLSDTPTDSADDGIGNFCTFNPLNPPQVSTLQLSNGNLELDATNNMGAAGTVHINPTGKQMFEVELDVDAGYGAQHIGLIDVDAYIADTNEWESGISGNGFTSTSPIHVYSYVDDGSACSNDSNASYGTAWSAGDVITVYYNNGAVWYALNGTLQNGATQSEVEAGTTTNAAHTGLSGITLLPFTFMRHTGDHFIANYGQKAFSGTVFDGFTGVATQNLPEPTIADGSQYFNTVIYAGDGNASGTAREVGFRPDLVWIKSRTASTGSTYNHTLTDSIRGVNSQLSSNSTAAETGLTNALTSFNDTGFTVAQNVIVNYLGDNYVAWCWKAGGTAVSNTDGSITSSVSANPTAGFSIVTYTGIRPTTGTVGHGLNEKPDMIIFKNRADATTWYVWHKDLTNQTTYALYLNTTAAQTNVGTSTFNNTAPTSTVFSLGNDSNVNDTSDSHVAYCWHSVEGFSKFGSYVGNGSTNGPFVYTGFRPAFVLIKKSSGTGSWTIQDNKRSTYNPSVRILQPDLSDAEVDENTAGGPYLELDFLSNGFKFRSTDNQHNSSGGTYIYMAFAENPFQGDDGYTQARAR